MLRNIIKITLRVLWKRRGFSVLNTLGLTLAMAAFLLLLQYIAFEMGVNQFHAQGEHIYRVIMRGNTGVTESTVPALGPYAGQNIPGIAAASRVIYNLGNGIITYEQPAKTNQAQAAKSFRENEILFVDPDFLKIFSFPVIKGNASLSKPNSVVLTQKQAAKYFGNTDPINKILYVDNQFGRTPYTVTGVLQDIPVQSDIQFTTLLSFTTMSIKSNWNGNDWVNPASWDNSYATTYFLTNPGTKAKIVAGAINRFINQRFPDAGVTLDLQPLTQLHLGPSLGSDMPTFGNLTLQYFLVGVGILILLIGWVNYINLSTAQSLKRAREVGVRKVFGAVRWQLMLQYLTESLVLNSLALALAVLLVFWLQPYFNVFIGKPLSLQVLNTNWVWSGGFLLLLTGTLLSGGYVALALVRFEPIRALRGSLLHSVSGARLRQALVVFQFAIAIALIIGSIILQSQLSFVQNQSPGIKLEQVLVIREPSVKSIEQGQSLQAFKAETSRLPFVSRISGSGNVPGGGYNFWANGITNLNPTVGDEKKMYAMLMVDEQYFPTYSISLVAGQNFTPAMCALSLEGDKVILNEKAARQLGFSDPVTAVGKSIKWGKNYQVTGVIKDYHHYSLHQTIDPIIFLPANGSNFSVQVSNTANLPQKLAAIEQLYRSTFPGNPFDYYFADASFNQQYQADQQFGRVSLAFTFLAIFIACLGLFGLAAFTAQQRTKEIGIRKVLGASVTSIVGLLSKDFLKLVLLANLVAWPLAWYAIHRWLQDFAYRIDINLGVFVLAGGLALFIALLTISAQAVRSALVNPVKSLRSE